MLDTVFSKLFGRGSQLSDLENLILNSIRDKLDGEIVTLWDNQVQSINKVQRLPEGVEVNFYRMRNGRPTFDSEMAFPNKTEELLLAQVKIGVPHISNKLIANIWCVKGFLFSIEYEGSVGYFEEAAGMDPQVNFTVSSEIKTDLLRKNQ